MPIITPSVSGNIQTPLAGVNPTEAALKALLLGQQSGMDHASKLALIAQGQDNSKQNLAEGLKTLLGSDKLSGVSIDDGGKISLQRKDTTLADAARAANFDLKKERLDESKRAKQAAEVQGIEDRVTKAGLPQSIESLKRVESVIPGLSEGKANFKSLGGIKNLIPNFVVPAIEGVGLLEKGSSDERAAMQDLANTKIYDSSGKQINESEMKRINDAMGLRGLFGTDTINQAGKQIADTVAQKRAQIAAGSDPEALDTFEKRRGLAGQAPLQSLIKPQSPPPFSPTPKYPNPNEATPPGVPSMSFEEFKRLKSQGKL